MLVTSLELLLLLSVSALALTANAALIMLVLVVPVSWLKRESCGVRLMSGDALGAAEVERVL